MKKLFIVLLCAGAIASCKKCHECHYDTAGGEVEIGEFCDEDLEQIENNGYTVGDTVYTVHCEAH